MSVFSKRPVTEVLAARQAHKKHRVLLVDDEPTILAELSERLSEHYHVLTAQDGQHALELVKAQTAQSPNSIQVIITDQRMPILSGVEFLERTLETLPHAKRIVLTAYSDVDVVIQSINRAGVFRFVVKPWEPAKMLATVRLALDIYEKERSGTRRHGEILGEHPKMKACLALVSRVADSDAPILIRGETGSGKELIARALYRNSKRRNKPFVAVHCAALPENLLESELFGHKRGAFTGASTDRLGRIASASGGTLFIDEVGELPLSTQTKLLRFFQSGEIQPVGSDRIERVDVRLITATHRDLHAMVSSGSFREDLYYRLKVAEIHLPPLRERRSDIPLLAHAMLRRYWQKDGNPRLNSDTLMILEAYPFPGNVRELEQIVKRACLLAVSTEIGPDLLTAEVLEGYNNLDQKDKVPSSKFQTLTNNVLKEARQNACRRASDEIEYLFLKQLMALHQDISAAARASGMARTYLHRLLTKHKLR